MSKPGIRAVIFDMGGVLLRTVDRSPRLKWERRLGLAEGELDPMVFDCPEAKLAGIGGATKNDIWKAVGARLGVGGSDLLQLESDFWSGDRLDEVLMEYIQSLRMRFLTAILSNAWPEARRMLEERYKVSPYFDAILISAEEKVAKPDVRIYHKAASRLGVTPAECVFIDDFPENIIGARQAGMQAVQFQNTRQIMADLQSLLA